MKTIAELNNELIAAKKELAEVQKAHRLYNKIQNEGYEGYNPHDDDLDNAISKCSDIQRELDDAVLAAEWTPDVFAARRTDWVDGIAKVTKNGMVAVADVKALEKRLGFTMSQLKRAKELNGY